VLAVLLSFAAGIRASLAATGAKENLIVIKPGATAESTSIILPAEISPLSQTPHMAVSDSGESLLSIELCVQTSIPRADAAGNLANVAVRGVDDVAFEVHNEVRLISGRRFQQGLLEVIVGKAAHERYRDLKIGDKLPLGVLGNRLFEIVGVFEAGGGALESEIWAPRTVLSDTHNRRFCSSAAIKLVDISRVEEATRYIEGPTVELDAKTETDYYDELSKTTFEIVVLTVILVSIMMVGAMFAVANTMYSAVDGRRREIAMLRTIGFSRASILLAFLIESILICAIACGVGLAGSLLVSGSKNDFFSDATFTVLAYELKLTPRILAAALGISILVGVGGALAPAIKASRTRIIEALRKA
jgi:putative ABC transport system permease protein